MNLPPNAVTPTPRDILRWFENNESGLYKVVVGNCNHDEIFSTDHALSQFLHRLIRKRLKMRQNIPAIVTLTTHGSVTLTCTGPW